MKDTNTTPEAKTMKTRKERELCDSNAKASFAASQPQHTPGPWKVRAADAVSPDVIAITSNGITVALIPVEEIHNEQANARLIAAAPELLGALKDIQIMIVDAVGTIDAKELNRNGVAELVNDLRRFVNYGTGKQAIAKAEGR